jgi:hypothetical protein
MTVTFGRTNGEKTRGVVVKCNPKKAKVQQSEARSGHAVGTIWNVPYALIHAEGVPEPERSGEYPNGLTIAGVRYLTAGEMKLEGWERESCVAVVLSDGSIIYASQDYEGNGPGALFGKTRHGETFWLTPATAGV